VVKIIEDRNGEIMSNLKKRKRTKVDFKYKVLDYLGGIGIFVEGPLLVVEFADADALEGDPVYLIDENDMDFPYMLNVAIETELSRLKQESSNVLFLQSIRYLCAKRPELAPTFIRYADMLTDEVYKHVLDGTYVPPYTFKGGKPKVSEYHTFDWIKKYRKHIKLRADLRVLRAMYFGKGYINAGDLDYSHPDSIA